MKNSDMVTIKLTKRQVVTVLCSLITVTCAVGETRPAELENVIEIHDTIRSQLNEQEAKKDKAAEEREFRKGLGV